MSPRWNWDSPTPLAASECALPPGPKGGGRHSPAAKGVGESQFQRLEKRLALCLLCAVYLEYHSVCPLDGIGTPSPASECASPAGTHSPACKGVGESQF
jgi:hypothetical protein